MPHMISEAYINKVLREGGLKYAPEQIRELRNFLYRLAEIELENINNNKFNVCKNLVA